MNEVLLKRMKRRKFRSKLKNLISFIFILALISSVSLFAVFSYADDKDKGGFKIVEVTDEDKEVDDECDELLIRGDMYFTEMTLDGFEMKTNKLKIETEKGVAVDNSELQYIFQYCNLWEVEELDLSSARLLDKEFRARVLLPCKTVKKITLPDNVTLLGDFVFYDWENLEEINMPSALTEIGKATFSGCKSLKEIEEWPVNLTKIGEQAFLECESFVDVKLPDTLKYIGKFAFADCTNLKEIIMPNNDELEVDGMLMGLSNTIISVYQDSAAYEMMVPIQNKTMTYICKNKILVRPVNKSNKLSKEPKVSEINRDMIVGDKKVIDDFISVEIKDTGAISYKVLCDEDLSLLKPGNNTINYKINYYLTDVDVREIESDVNKVDSMEELYDIKIDADRDSRFFVNANIVEKEYKIKIKVCDYTSPVSKKVNELSEKYSKTLNAKKHSAYMTGFKDGSFKPKESLTNAEVAAIIARLNGYDKDKTYTHNYFDVNKESWQSNYVGYVTEKKIMNGYNGMFRPQEKITRAEFIIAIAKMIGLKPVYDRRSQFVDVMYKSGEEYIVAFEDLQIVNGLPDGSFGYSKEVTRAEACKIINSALGRRLNPSKITKDQKEQVKFSDVAEFNWFYQDVLEASVDHYEHELH